MGKISYSITERVCNVAEMIVAKQKNDGKFVPQTKFYASAQQTDYMTLDRFAEHISQHHSKYGKGDVYCVLIEMVSCLREQLLLGNKVSLGDLGDFFITLSCKGAEYYNEFSAQNITKINVVWEQGDTFKTLRKDANFELVETRKASAETLKKVREAYPTRPELDSEDPEDATIMHTLNISSENAAQGSVNTAVNKDYEKGSSVEIKATPASGYEFDQWSDGNKNATRTVIMTEDLTLVAKFKSASGGTVTPPAGGDDDDMGD